ncbi:MAG: thymidine phosphorylase [Asgard group archaeon]|nr:thymidine phosphorylase [Asgard group archaeon]
MDFTLSVKPLDIEAGGKYIVVLNEAWANHNGIYAGDRVKIKQGKHELIGIVDTSDTSIEKDEIGIFEEIEREYGFQAEDTVKIERVEKTESSKYIREKLDRKKLTQQKIDTIINDIVDRRITDSEIAAFVISTYTRKWSLEEIAFVTKAMVNTGEVLKWEEKPIMNKHCLGGVPGNRTTMIVVPIIAAAGLKIPKTSSRAITSPAGTADTMEVLAEVNFSSEEIKKIVQETNGCMVWGGKVDMAPADSAMIRVLNPLRLDPVPITIASIMAKKKASGTSHLIIDIPYGNKTKVPDKKAAKAFKEKFKKINEILEIKTTIVLTEGSQPIGNGIGPVLEAKDVLKVLEQKKDRLSDMF